MPARGGLVVAGPQTKASGRRRFQRRFQRRGPDLLRRACANCKDTREFEVTALFARQRSSSYSQANGTSSPATDALGFKLPNRRTFRTARALQAQVRALERDVATLREAALARENAHSNTLCDLEETATRLDALKCWAIAHAKNDDERRAIDAICDSAEISPPLSPQTSPDFVDEDCTVLDTGLDTGLDEPSSASVPPAPYDPRKPLASQIPQLQAMGFVAAMRTLNEDAFSVLEEPRRMLPLEIRYRQGEVRVVVAHHEDLRLKNVKVRPFLHNWPAGKLPRVLISWSEPAMVFNAFQGPPLEGDQGTDAYMVQNEWMGHNVHNFRTFTEPRYQGHHEVTIQVPFFAALSCNRASLDDLGFSWGGIPPETLASEMCFRVKSREGFNVSSDEYQWE